MGRGAHGTHRTVLAQPGGKLFSQEKGLVSLRLNVARKPMGEGCVSGSITRHPRELREERTEQTWGGGRDTSLEVPLTRSWCLKLR